jgi:hypothetical protein
MGKPVAYSVTIEAVVISYDGDPINWDADALIDFVKSRGDYEVVTTELIKSDGSSLPNTHPHVGGDHTSEG